MFRIENRFGFRKIGFRRIVFYLNIVDIPIYRFLSCPSDPGSQFAISLELYVFCVCWDFVKQFLPFGW